jgi:hypothetical protein
VVEKVKQVRKSPLRSARGRLVAELLAGSWRAEPPAIVNSAEELSAISRLLLKAGAGGLAWCKVRHSDLKASLAARKLQQAYRVHSLQAALHERNLKQVIELLDASRIEAVLVKGWAIARLYPEPGMRPYGDLDLCVLPEDYDRAKKVFDAARIPECDIDLHSGFGKFYDREAEDIFARSAVVKLGDLGVRVLSAEDDLRFLCLHLLRHGAVRAPWLCDIAMALETRPTTLDWDRVLRGSCRQADWVACALGLAHQLLGADVSETPVANRARKLPRWLASTVLEEWGTPYRFPGQLAVFARHPVSMMRGLIGELPHHWPNPIEATMTLEGPFNSLPRLPFQVGHLLSRATVMLAELPQIVGGPLYSRSR